MNKPSFEFENEIIGTIKQPSVYKTAMIWLIIIFPALTVLVPLFAEFNGQKITYIEALLIMSVVFVPLTIACAFLLVFTINWKIEIKPIAFTYTNMFKKSKTYNYAEIEMKILKSCVKIYKKDGKRIVGISFLQDNWQVLISTIKTYKKSNGLGS
jgi:hypothetical protein